MRGDTPNIIGGARASNVFFLNTQVAEAAARSLAELMGGVMEVSKSSKAETSSTTSAKGAGTSFFIGDSDAPDEQETTMVDSDTNASVCNTSAEAF